MLSYSVTRIDLARTPQPPADLLHRKNASDQWYTPAGPVEPGRRVTWLLCKRGERVQIPLYRYRTADKPSDILGFALQIGVTAAFSLSENRNVRSVSRLHIALGEPAVIVTDGTQDYIEFHIGIGMQAEAVRNG